jgi:Ca2+-binding RTX toxin-like protein
MASIPGGQYNAFTQGGQQVNVVMTTDGNNLPPPIPGEFNLEVITGGVVPPGLPPGYQGVAVLSDNGQTINMAYGNWALQLTGDPTVIGGAGSDTISGGNAPAMIIGGAGPDLIYGGSGPDTIQGGGGPDTIYGGNGPDAIYGGNGPDAIHGGSGNDTIQGGSGADQVYLGGGQNTVFGGSGPDTIDGGSGQNQIYTGTGGTLIQDSGEKGQDTVVGFNQAHGDAITFAGQDTASIDHVVATANVSGGSTTITLPDGSTMTLVGITHIDSSFFH